MYKLVVKFCKNTKFCQSQHVEQRETITVKVFEISLSAKKIGNVVLTKSTMRTEDTLTD